MGKFVALLGGIIAIAGGIILVIIWWDEFYKLLLGFIPLILFLAGLIAVIAGITSFKDHKRAKKLEKQTEEEAS